MRTAHQRGYSLIIAVAVVTLLTLLGVLVLDSVFTDTQLSGGDRGSINAMYLAEAGSVWGQQTLINMLLPPGSAGSQPSAAAMMQFMALPPLANNDPVCPENSCIAPPCPATIACTNWYQLTPTAWVSYGTAGQYRVAATCNPGPCTTNPNSSVTFSIRSLGKWSDQSQRLLETTVGP